MQVTGSRGPVIGDYATVYQYFGRAPDDLAIHIRTEFRALVDERTREFVGRDFIFDSIDSILADSSFSSGYIVVLGEPGIGKTALMSQLLKRRNYVHHFNIRGQGIRSHVMFLENVCAQLIVRYGLDYISLPARATTDSGFLSRLLSKIAEEPANRPVVVAIDALDEADIPFSGSNRLFLPESLPEGVYFIVSSRPKYDFSLRATSRRDIYLRDDDPQNVEDVRAYIRSFIDEHAAVMAERIAAWRTTEAELLSVLVGKSEGNFLYLVNVLRDIEKGLLTGSNVDRVENLPQGLRGYYEDHWRDMRSADADFDRYQEPVVCFLAVAREPVSRNQIEVWTAGYWQKHAWDSSELRQRSVRGVIESWLEFLNVEQAEDGMERYRMYHASLRDYLADAVGLTRYDGTISDVALAKLPPEILSGKWSQP